jgi:hypothetical protein
MTGDAAGGALYVAGDIALMAGTLIWAYFLLPSNVQFSSLDYLNSPLVGISNAWQSNSIVEYLPSFGVLLGGAILKGILGHFSAESAARAARQNIEDGKVTFTPNFDFDRRGFGMGMMMRY